MKDLFRPTDTKDRRRGSSVRIAGLSGVDEQCGDPPMPFPRLLLAQDRGFPCHMHPRQTENPEKREVCCVFQFQAWVKMGPVLVSCHKFCTGTMTVDKSDWDHSGLGHVLIHSRWG